MPQQATVADIDKLLEHGHGSGTRQLRYRRLARGDVDRSSGEHQPADLGREARSVDERHPAALAQPDEIDRIAGGLAEKGLTLVPLQVYFKNGNAKVELALARCKSTVDKRNTIRDREHQREMDRAVRRRN